MVGYVTHPLQALVSARAGGSGAGRATAVMGCGEGRVRELLRRLEPLLAAGPCQGERRVALACPELFSAVLFLLPPLCVAVFSTSFYPLVAVPLPCFSLIWPDSSCLGTGATRAIWAVCPRHGLSSALCTRSNSSPGGPCCIWTITSRPRTSVSTRRGLSRCCRHSQTPSGPRPLLSSHSRTLRWGFWYQQQPCQWHPSVCSVHRSPYHCFRWAARALQHLGVRGTRGSILRTCNGGERRWWPRCT